MSARISYILVYGYPNSHKLIDVLDTMIACEGDNQAYID